jgi:periplasmic copper chaperone A
MSLKVLCRFLRAVAPLAAAASIVVAPNIAALAENFTTGAITIERPWSRATPGGAKVASGYFTVKNAGDAPDRLLSVTADIAGHTGIHQMSMSDGMMQMRELTDGLAIPAQGSLTLEPASYHLMFEDLKRPLKEGETFSGTLTFEKAGTVSVTFDVRGLGASSP